VELADIRRFSPSSQTFHGRCDLLPLIERQTNGSGSGQRSEAMVRAALAVVLRRLARTFFDAEKGRIQTNLLITSP
jgi:hypothetical protein